MVRHRVGGLHLTDSIQEHVYGLVAVGMCVDLQPGPVVRGQPVGELVRWDQPDSVGSAVVESRPPEAGGSALDGAVQEKLHVAETEVVR